MGSERGERGKSREVGQFLPDEGPGQMGIRHQEQEAGPPGKLNGITLLLHGGP